MIGRRLPGANHVPLFCAVGDFTVCSDLSHVDEAWSSTHGAHDTLVVALEDQGHRAEDLQQNAEASAWNAAPYREAHAGRRNCCTKGAISAVCGTRSQEKMQMTSLTSQPKSVDVRAVATGLSIFVWGSVDQI